MPDAVPAGGDILVYAKVRDPEARGLLNSLLENLPGERVSSTLYEVVTADGMKGSGTSKSNECSRTLTLRLTPHFISEYQ